MNYLIPSRFIGKSFLWAFVLMIILLTGPRYWAASAGFSSAVSHGLYRAAGFIPFMIHAVTGCSLDRMWIAAETRFDSPVKYWLLLLACLLFGLMLALGTNPDTMKSSVVAPHAN